MITRNISQILRLLKCKPFGANFGPDLPDRFWRPCLVLLNMVAKIRMRNRETTPLRMLIVEAQHVEIRRLLFSALGNQLVAQTGE